MVMTFVSVVFMIVTGMIAMVMVVITVLSVGQSERAERG